MSKLNTTRYSKPVVTNSSDELQIKAAMDGEKDREKDIQFLLSQPRGRRWLHGLIYDKCHVGSLSHVPRDTHSTAFNEGARSVGEALQEEIRSNHHALYLKMLEENDVRTD